MSRNAQMIRFLKMIRLLESSNDGVTILEMAAQFHVHPKTIRRDLAAMKKAEVSLVEVTRNECRYYRIDDDRFAATGAIPKFDAPRIMA